REPLRRPAQPGLGHHLSQLRYRDPVEPDQHRRVPVEVRRGEVQRRIVGQQRLLGAEVGYPDPEDRPVRRRVAERVEVAAPQRPLPDEELVPDPPLQQALAGGALVGLGQLSGDPSYVVPAGHDRYSSRSAGRAAGPARVPAGSAAVHRTPVTLLQEGQRTGTISPPREPEKTLPVYLADSLTVSRGLRYCSETIGGGP